MRGFPLNPYMADCHTLDNLSHIILSLSNIGMGSLDEVMNVESAVVLSDMWNMTSGYREIRHQAILSFVILALLRLRQTIGEVWHFSRPFYMTSMFDTKTSLSV